jgi:hypothetical protein
MSSAKDVGRIFQQEFPELANNLIFQDDDGSYHVFSRYTILPEKAGFRVFCAASDVGYFTNTKTALSWCIADKNKLYSLARDILNLDNKLSSLTSDISARAIIADRSKNVNFRETIGTKLETKIIRKKIVEEQLNKCISWAKYCQQRGFNNETVRTGRNQAIKASR